MNESGKTLKILNQTFDKILNISVILNKNFCVLYINIYNNQNHNYVIDKENL